MADDLSDRGGRDRSRISVDEEHVVRYWTQTLGISKEQLAGQYPVWQTSLVNPDFTAYARLCGATGIPVHRADELDDGMKELFAADGPALLHVHSDAELT